MRDPYADAFVDDDMEPNEDLNRVTNAIIGAAIAVHRELGPCHLECAYQRALEIEFDHCGILYQRQVPVTLKYRGKVVGDMLVTGVDGRLDLRHHVPPDGEIDETEDDREPEELRPDDLGKLGNLGHDGLLSGGDWPRRRTG